MIRKTFAGLTATLMTFSAFAATLIAMAGSLALQAGTSVA